MINLWAFLGIFHLFFLAIQDIFNKNWIDDRHNWFMLGATIMLLNAYKRGFIYIMLIVLSILLIVFILKKLKLMASGDFGAVTWTFMGFAFIQPMYMVYYAVILCFILMLFAGYSRIIGARRKLTYLTFPMYPAFLIAYSIVALIYI